MTAITPELRRAIEESGDRPTRLVDPETNSSYVLIRSEEFERLRSLLAEDGEASALHPLVDRVFGAEGWDDPVMDAYDESKTPRRSR
jgi:hypothetical protein